MTFENLEAWQCCRALRIFVSKSIVPVFPPEEKFRLADQIIRASRSTTANIAEGYGRFHYKETVQYFRIARGSAYEVLEHMITALDEDLVSAELLADTRGRIETAVKLINGYIRYLKSQQTMG